MKAASNQDHLKPKICVSGAAETGHCGPNAMELGKELGREIVRQGGVLVTGATTGFPLWSAIGAKEAGGISVGLSPAASQHEHVDSYKLPVDYMDFIIYTGFGYSGRNLLLTRTADAVIVGCGRIGTLNEFTVAFEDGKPIGVLEGEWQFDELIQDIIKQGHRPNDNIIYDASPKNLIKRLLQMIAARQKLETPIYRNPDNVTQPADKSKYKIVM
jgi:uncharacterized protein (TIGR00725 family)